MTRYMLRASRAWGMERGASITKLGGGREGRRCKMKQTLYHGIIRERAESKRGADGGAWPTTRSSIPWKTIMPVASLPNRLSDNCGSPSLLIRCASADRASSTVPAFHHHRGRFSRREGCDERPSTLAQDCQNRHNIGRASGHRCRAGSQYSLQLPHLCPARQSRQRTATDERQLHIERPVARTGGIVLHNHPPPRFFIRRDCRSAVPAESVLCR